MFMAAVQLLDGAKPNTNPNPNTNLIVILILTLFDNPIRKITYQTIILNTRQDGGKC